MTETPRTISEPSRLSDLTTLRLGGPIGRLRTARGTAELITAVREADEAAEPLLIVGGGSNLVAADEGWPGVVVLVRSRGVEWSVPGTTAGNFTAADATPADATVTVAAGENWDDLARVTIEAGWSGLETMVGIPGLVGAAPVQNAGAYGSEVADVLAALTVLDRETGAVTAWSPEQCGFGFRTSAFKHTDRYVILDVTIRLRRAELSVPIRYAELARRLGVEQGDRAPITRVRETVLELRRGKAMVLDDADPDTWSVGSFFINPVVDDEAVPPGCPSWAVDGRIKLSAAWLIEHAGFGRGYGLDRPPGTVSLSTKHCLAVTNRGGASARELLELAGAVRDGVEARFGIRLRPEPRLAGVEL